VSGGNFEWLHPHPGPFPLKGEGVCEWARARDGKDLVISVVVTSFNRLATLQLCLAALLGQRVSEAFEVIVIDEGSTDGSIEWVREWTGCDRRLKLDIFPKRPLNAKRNRGLYLATGDLVAFVDDDAVVAPGWLAALSGARASGAGIVTGRILSTVPNALRGERASTRRRIWGKSWMHQLVCWMPGCGTNMAVTKACMARIGVFDEELGAGSALDGGGDETELFFRAMRFNERIQYVPEMLVHHHHRNAPDAWRRRTWGYYQGFAAALAYRYPTQPNAWALVAVRLGHSILMAVLYGLVGRHEEAYHGWLAAKATLVGWGQGHKAWKQRRRGLPRAEKPTRASIAL
jgi:glycosyltransferase involved in cell wall biosynthesis